MRLALQLTKATEVIIFKKVHGGDVGGMLEIIKLFVELVWRPFEIGKNRTELFNMARRCVAGLL